MIRKMLLVLCFFMTAFVSLVSPIVPKVWAQGGANVAVDCSDIGANGVPLDECFKLNQTDTVKSVYGTPNVLINLLVRVAFLGGGIILFVTLIIAGYKFVLTPTSQGKDEALQMIQGAVAGFLIMFAAYWIIQVIKVLTGANILI